jgi:hypothetical protein
MTNRIDLVLNIDIIGQTVKTIVGASQTARTLTRILSPVFRIQSRIVRRVLGLPRYSHLAGTDLAEGIGLV